VIHSSTLLKDHQIWVTGEADVLTCTHYITVATDLVTTAITYSYDPLYRLTSAAYSAILRRCLLTLSIVAGIIGNT
jgi:hypothetical protein